MIRLVDLFFGIIAIIALGPIFIVVSIILKLTGEREIFYTQKRIGVNEATFKIFKFATMLKNSPNMPGGNITKENDPRILPLGHVLRRTKINELPQLLNILNGSMSFIGPRPMTVENYSLYPKQVQLEIAKLRPGLSGVASIVFRNEEKLLAYVDDIEKYYAETIAPYKAELEIWFCKNRSLKLHLALITLTAISVISPKSVVLWNIFPTIPKPNKELAAQLIEYR